MGAPQESKLMNTIANKPKLNLTLTRRDWELFSPDKELPAKRVAEAAKALNKAVVDAITAGMSRSEVEKAVNAVRDQYADTGAGDSEPGYVLRDLLDDIFSNEAFLQQWDHHSSTVQ